MRQRLVPIKTHRWRGDHENEHRILYCISVRNLSWCAPLNYLLIIQVSLSCSIILEVDSLGCGKTRMAVATYPFHFWNRFRSCVVNHFRHCRRSHTFIFSMNTNSLVYHLSKSDIRFKSVRALSHLWFASKFKASWERGGLAVSSQRQRIGHATFSLPVLCNSNM